MQVKNSTQVKIILDLLAVQANVKGIKGLAKFLGEPSSRLYGWIRNGKIFDTKSILTKFPNINEEWLKSGEGPTFKYQPPRGDQIIFDQKNIPVPEGDQPPAPPPEYAFDMPEMVKMTMEVLASDTDHRSALASHIKASHKAVNMEKEMEQLREDVSEIKSQNKVLLDELRQVIDVLKAAGLSVPEKRDKKAM